PTAVGEDARQLLRPALEDTALLRELLAGPRRRLVQAGEDTAGGEEQSLVRTRGDAASEGLAHLLAAAPGEAETEAAGGQLFGHPAQHHEIERVLRQRRLQIPGHGLLEFQPGEEDVEDDPGPVPGRDGEERGELVGAVEAAGGIGHRRVEKEPRPAGSGQRPVEIVRQHLESVLPPRVDEPALAAEEVDGGGKLAVGAGGEEEDPALSGARRGERGKERSDAQAEGEARLGPFRRSGAEAEPAAQ